MVEGSITQNEDSYIYNFAAISNVNDATWQALINIDLVNTSPENNILFRFSGQNEDLVLEFPIWDDGSDHSGGTAPAGIYTDNTVETVDEQIDYLKRYIFKPGFDIDWTLIQARYAPSALTVKGAIERLEFINNPGGVNVALGRIIFKRGKVTGTL